MSGVRSDGFQSVESPQTAARAAFQLQTAPGTLQALMPPTPPSGCRCSTMFRVSPNHLLWVLDALRDGVVHNRIVVPEREKEWTRLALDRMLEIH